MVKSMVVGWWSTRMASGVPHCPQNHRSPKSEDRRLTGWPRDRIKSLIATVAKAATGEPVASWHRRQ
jgi:hypothetical protein